MILKAGYFAFIGFRDTVPITINDLRTATTKTTLVCGLVWSGNWHNLVCWGDLLVRHRNYLGFAYSDPQFGSSVVAHAGVVYLRWRETLRYHKNAAYLHEVDRVRASTRWFLDNSDRL